MSREYDGALYWNCEHYTDGEMAIIANWNKSPEREKQAIRDKSNWKSTELYRTDEA